MKTRYVLVLAIFVLVLASCQTPAQKSSGTYTGPYSSSGLTNNAGNGTMTITTVSTKRINMVFSSTGNSNINIPNVDITDIVGNYILDLSDDQGGTASMSATITSNILAVAYSDTTYSLSVAGFTKQ